MARGHRIESVPELPLVIGDSAESVEKTSAAIDILKQFDAYLDTEKAKDSHAIHPGKGKMRNRRYISRKGPLIVYGMEGAKLVKAFQNIPGVEVANVDRLNLLKLAPGGHLGRFVIWTKSAFKKLDSIYGSFEKKLRRRRMGTCCPVQKWLMLIWLGILNSVPSPLACLNLRPRNQDLGLPIPASMHPTLPGFSLTASPPPKWSFLKITLVLYPIDPFSL